MKVYGTWVALAALGFGWGPARAQDKPEPTAAQQAATILQTHCRYCHGGGGTAEGGLNFVMSPHRLAEENYLVPGDPRASRLLHKLMPDTRLVREDHHTIRDTDKETLIQWITELAPETVRVPVKRPLVTEDVIAQTIRDDLAKQSPRERKHLRYFSVAHLANAGASDDELASFRVALTKLLNGLSWNTAVRKPVAIDKP